MTTLSRMRFINETHQKPFKMNGNATLVAQAVMRSPLLLTTMNFYFAHVKCKWTTVINLWDFHNEDFQVLLSVTGNMAIVQYLWKYKTNWGNWILRYIGITCVKFWFYDSISLCQKIIGFQPSPKLNGSFMKKTHWRFWLLYQTWSAVWISRNFFTLRHHWTHIIHT